VGWFVLRSKPIIGSLILLLSLALSLLSLVSLSITPVYSSSALKVHSYDNQAYLSVSDASHFVSINASALVTDQHGNPVQGATVTVVVDGKTHCSTSTNQYGRNDPSTADCTVAVSVGYPYWHLSASLISTGGGSYTHLIFETVETPTYVFYVHS
jgi:hypothetical protein